MLMIKIFPWLEKSIQDVEKIVANYRSNFLIKISKTIGRCQFDYWKKNSYNRDNVTVYTFLIAFVTAN